MDRLPLDSRLLTAVAYSPAERTLYLRFRKTGDVHRYFDFPQEQLQALLDAESRGRYFLSHIRSRFRYDRLARLEIVATT